MGRAGGLRPQVVTSQRWAPSGPSHSISNGASKGAFALAQATCSKAYAHSAPTIFFALGPKLMFAEKLMFPYKVAQVQTTATVPAGLPGRDIKF